MFFYLSLLLVSSCASSLGMRDADVQKGKTITRTILTSSAGAPRLFCYEIPTKKTEIFWHEGQEKCRIFRKGKLKETRNAKYLGKIERRLNQESLNQIEQFAQQPQGRLEILSDDQVVKILESESLTGVKFVGKSNVLTFQDIKRAGTVTYIYHPKDEKMSIFIVSAEEQNAYKTKEWITPLPSFLKNLVPRG